MQLIYNGWSLAYLPNSAAALHLLTLLEAHPAKFATAVALPAPSFHRLPPGIEAISVSVPNTESGRLQWEQRKLPALAQASGAGFIHTPDRRAALFGEVQTISSPTEASSRMDLSSAGLPGRAADALAQGGMTRVRAAVWPEDLPDPPDLAVKRLAPAIHPAFRPDFKPVTDGAANTLDLPDTYILYHGPADDPGLRCVLEAWSWAVGPIGEYYPLLLLGLDTAAQDRLAHLSAEYGLTGTARPLPFLDLAGLSAAYRSASVVFHPHETGAWGSSARLALAAGRPLVGLESERMGALTGPAAYLVRSGGDATVERRALGAALISVVVEESLAEGLAHAARERTEAWSLEAFSAGLERLYAALFKQ